MIRKVWLLCILVLPGLAFSQKKADRALAGALQEHLTAVRGPAADAAQEAVRRCRYISGQFHLLGLVPRGNDTSYLQPVITDQGKRYEPGSALKINGQSLQPGTEFIPVSFSGLGAAGGSPLIAVQERKQPWIMDVHNYFDSVPPEALFRDSLYKLAAQAVTDQAVAVIFYDSKGNIPGPGFEDTVAGPPLSIPVVYVTGDAASRYLKDPTASVDVHLQVSMVSKKDTVYTVIGGIDNGAASTIVVAGSTPEDNAMLIELARIVKTSRQYQHKNYLFAALPENKGISAGKYFFEHLPKTAAKPGCVLLLRGAAGTALTIQGTGTAPEWNAMLERLKEKAPARRMEATRDSSLATDIPALSFSGGGDGQYNAKNDAATLHFLSNLLEALNRKGNGIIAKGD